MLEKEYKEIFFKYAEQYRVLKRERYSLLKKMYFEQTDLIVYNYSQWLKHYNELLKRVDNENNENLSQEIKDILIEIIEFSDTESDCLLQEIINISEKSSLEYNAMLHEEHAKCLIVANTYLLNLFNKEEIPKKDKNNVVFLFQRKKEPLDF
ncbi:hypothetical protein ACTOJ1_000673 [Shigella flexneri]